MGEGGGSVFLQIVPGVSGVNIIPNQNFGPQGWTFIFTPDISQL